MPYMLVSLGWFWADLTPASVMIMNLLRLDIAPSSSAASIFGIVLEWGNYVSLCA
jgi:hypothetical protein